MKRESEAECIARLLKKSSGTSCKQPIDECLNCKVYWRIADSILAALKRRGWTPPKPKKGRGK